MTVRINKYIILYYIGENDSEISKKIIKSPLDFPINIPISSSCVELLKGLLEKNPQLRIELSSKLIENWINDNTINKYQKKLSKLEKSLFELKLEPIISSSNIIEINKSEEEYKEEDILKEKPKFKFDQEDKPSSLLSTPNSTSKPKLGNLSSRSTIKKSTFSITSNFNSTEGKSSSPNSKLSPKKSFFTKN